MNYFKATNRPYVHISQRLATLFLISMLGISTALHAQFNPPIVEYQNLSRELDLLIDYNLDEDDPGDGEIDEVIHTEEGVWSKRLSIARGPASAEATTNSKVGRFSVTGESRVTASLGSGIYAGDAGALSAVSFSFSLPVDTDFALTANFEFLNQVATGWSRGQVVMSGMDGQAVFLREVDSEDPSTWNIFFTGSMTAGNTGTFLILVHAQRGKNPSKGSDETGVAVGEVEFKLDFGDRDGDGLLDAWEEEDRIDLGDGAVVDLTSYDPDPDKKDLFLEIDVAHVIPGIDLESEIVPMVVDSFADAPGELVNNPDGSDGITLHVFVNETLPSENAVLQFADEPTLPAEYYEAKNRYQATAALRDHPFWEAGPLKEAWQSVFRYSLWVDRLQRPLESACLNPTPCDFGDFSQIGGRAESFGGNDLVVAAGHLHCRKTHSPTATIDDSKASMAGALMHELGHALGLTHGGGQDRATFLKPNFISVMNYFHATPWTAVTAQGTTGRDAWTLDYSRQVLASVDETSLREDQGLDGPLLCRQGNPPILRPCKVLFNSKPVADPADQSEVSITIGHPFLDDMDWNNDGIISSEPLNPTVDTTRTYERSRCSGGLNPVFLEQMDSFTDWDVLSLAPPLDDPTRAVAGARGPSAEGIVEMDQFEYFSILEQDWFDQTAMPDELFKDGFEGPR